MRMIKYIFFVCFFVFLMFPISASASASDFTEDSDIGNEFVESDDFSFAGDDSVDFSDGDSADENSVDDVLDGDVPDRDVSAGDAPDDGDSADDSADDSAENNSAEKDNYLDTDTKDLLKEFLEYSVNQFDSGDSLDDSSVFSDSVDVDAPEPVFDDAFRQELSDYFIAVLDKLDRLYEAVISVGAITVVGLGIIAGLFAFRRFM